jgi:hypothetical protein
MTFVPTFSAVFEEPVITNTKGLIEDNFKDALDYFYAADDLPDFAEIALGQELGDAFPLCVIGPRTNPIESSDDGAQLLEVAAIDIHMGVVADTPANVTTLIMRYVRCMDAVLRSATKLDYFGEGATKLMGFHLDVGHTYGPFGRNKSILFRPATVNLTISIRETSGG